MIVNLQKQEPVYSHDLAFDLFGNDGIVSVGFIDPNAENCIGIFGDGAWEKVTNAIGTFVVKKDNFKIPYIKEIGQPSFTLKLPKLPYGLLKGISMFFQEVMKRIHDSESMVQIYWNAQKSEYFVYVPLQQVTKAAIAFERSKELQADPNMICVMEIHSH